MRQTALFTKTRRDAPSDETARNAELLIRAGYVHKEAAGVYDYLPLGHKVLNKIVGVIRDEMNTLGAVELSMSALQDKQVWEKTNRWSDESIDVWFKTELKSGGEMGLGVTHEEPLTRIMSEHISSYRDLPVYAYQFQNKFRNELRAKSGVMRGREFLMKDLYSFCKDEAEHQRFYESVREAYKNIFERLGLRNTYVTYASGGAFSDFSEEFQTVCEAGEDTIYVDETKGIAVNKEVMNEETLATLGLSKDSLVEKKSIEVGNIFTLGTRFSEPLGLSYMDETGVSTPVFMGSYGIGPSRIMGVIVELLADEKGIVWPENVAPFKYHLLSLMPDNDEVRTFADNLYEQLSEKGIEVLYDDRSARAGEKFADADLLGMPWRVNVGKQVLESGRVELVNRVTGETTLVSPDELV